MTFKAIARSIPLHWSTIFVCHAASVLRAAYMHIYKGLEPRVPLGTNYK